MIDRFTRWPEAVPLENIEAVTVATALMNHWVTRFGVPARITTDQERQFTSQLFKELNLLIGSQHFRTTAFHPQANGMVERFHRQLKAALRCYASDDWTQHLSTILLGIRTAWKGDLKATSAELVYGENIRLPGEFLVSHQQADEVPDPTDFVYQLRQRLKQIRPTPASQHGSKQIFVFKELDSSTHVFVRHDAPKGSLQPCYDGPFEVVERKNKYFVISIRGKEVAVSIDRLKPAYVLAEHLGEQDTTSNFEPERDTPSNSSTDAIPTTRFGRKIRFPERFVVK